VAGDLFSVGGSEIGGEKVAVFEAQPLEILAEPLAKLLFVIEAQVSWVWPPCLVNGAPEELARA
jgi:hypothetical protein